MKNHLRVLGALAILFLASPAYAQSTAYGNGAASCGLFVKAVEASEQGDRAVDSYMMWLSGYASLASAQTGIDYFNGTDNPRMQAWLEKWCRAHPLGMFDEAAAELMGELARHQLGG